MRQIIWIITFGLGIFLHPFSLHAESSSFEKTELEQILNTLEPMLKGGCKQPKQGPLKLTRATF